MITFLRVNVFPRRRLLLELACLPSTACPLASSFMSLQGNVILLNTLQTATHTHSLHKKQLMS